MNSIRQIDSLLETLQIHQPPAPVTFCVSVSTDHLRWEKTHEGRLQIAKYLRKEACRNLADQIFDRCQFFPEADLMSGQGFWRMELTVNDLGAYRNYVPEAERRGEAKGRAKAVQQMTDSLPYGLAAAATEFYE